MKSGASRIEIGEFWGQRCYLELRGRDAFQVVGGDAGATYANISYEADS